MSKYFDFQKSPMYQCMCFCLEMICTVPAIKPWALIVSSLCLFSSYPSSHWHWHTLKSINTLLNWTVLCRILSELGYEDCYLILTGHATVHAKQQHEPVYVSTREKIKFFVVNKLNKLIQNCCFKYIDCLHLVMKRVQCSVPLYLLLHQWLHSSPKYKYRII